MRIVCIAKRNSLKLHMRTSEEPLPNKNYKLEESHFGWLQIEIAAQQDTVCSNNHRYCIILGAVVLNTGGFYFSISRPI